MGGLDALAGAAENAALAMQIAGLFHITEESAARYLENSIIFTHGIVSLAASGVMKCTKQQVKDKVNQAGFAFLMQEGAAVSYARSLKNCLSEREAQER